MKYLQLLLLPALLYGWAVASSAIYLALAGHFELFRFPFLQWFVVRPFWWINPTMELYVIGSGIAPGIVVALYVFGMVRYQIRQRTKRSIYGETGFANERDMRAGGFNLRDGL